METKRKYWSDILLALDAIDIHLQGITTYEEYAASITVKDAVERRLIIIGEAVNKLVLLDPDTRSRMARRSAHSGTAWCIRTMPLTI